jgi:beta-galactosidase
MTNRRRPSISAFAILTALLAAAAPRPCAAGEAAQADPRILDAVPPGYALHACDDCGALDRQPHFDMTDCYAWTFQTSDTEADLKSRSAVFSYKSLNARYDGLDPARSHVLAVTYASDHVYKRVQSLWADGVELHGPYPLPLARAVRLVVPVPREVTADGSMALQWRIHGEVNATASIVELWADGPPAGEALRIRGISGMVSDLEGQVLDLAWNPAAGAEVTLRRGDDPKVIASARTGADGRFRFPRVAFDDGKKAPEDLRLAAALPDGRSASVAVPADRLRFEPVRYRPIPSKVEGLTEHRISLDGTWRIRPEGPVAARAAPLDGPGWKDFRVPGQWRQQGFKIPPDRTIAVAREFALPREWAGRRILLRFEAVHAGTRYFLNGKLLGSSENLFTPIEWDITGAVRVGETNRLDLEMKVDTASERLSHSSGYAFHDLGGIDRSVSLYALPPVHARALRLDAGLRADGDGDLRIEMTVDCAREGATPVDLDVLVWDPEGRPVAPTGARQMGTIAGPGEGTLAIDARVPAPLPWSAERPRLYSLALELRSGGALLERIERRVGLRRVEVRGSRLLLNGAPIKLAGACHHETDPLTGRAGTAVHAEEDLRLLKAANLNYVRTSHYPPCMELVEAADRLGVYLEVEAPFCWVGPEEDLSDLKEVLTPTSAMVDLYRDHPSVLIWSLANESHFNRSFEISKELVKRLDPTRPTTFNNPDPKPICDIANLHYPPMPYDAQAAGDPRPLLLGEYWFPVCHEQTDVRINPGLREFFGAGQADPGSAVARRQAEAFAAPYLKPCTPPGTWTHIVRSSRVIGGAIWASLDEPFWFPDGERAGYAWHHGFWGIIDAWRRPKPEWWLAKMVFSPVWFPERRIEYKAGQTSVRVPVENRHSFTDLSELIFNWEIGASRGVVRTEVAPGAAGSLEIPVPPGTTPGARLIVRATDHEGRLVTVFSARLGDPPPVVLPKPRAGPPVQRREGDLLFIEGDGFALVFDAASGDLVPSDPRHRAAVLRFPVPHLTRYDFGDLAGAHGKPYAVFPDPKTRKVEAVRIEPRPDCLEISVRDRYDVFAGTVTWRIDRAGMGKVTWDHVWSGPETDTREAGVRFALRPECEEVRWRREGEWGVYPDDSICRAEGTARAFRPGTRGADREGLRPSWPWSQDQTEMGTADFRSVKFDVYDAAVAAPGGPGLRLHAAGDLHVRPCVSEEAVLMHVLTRCVLGQVTVKAGDRIAGECAVEILP